MKRGKKQDTLILLVVVVCVFYFLTAGFSLDGYSIRDIRCIQYLRQGTLYGGQAECVQPPMMYLFGVFLTLFGVALLQPLTYLSILCLNVSTLYFISKLVASKEKTVNMCVYIVYCVVVLPLTVAQLDTSLALFFGFSGIYILLNRKGVSSDYVGFFLIFSAVASKITAVSALVAVGFFYAYTNALKIKGKEITWLFFYTLRFLLAFLVYAIVLRLVFPKIIVYTILSHYHGETLTFS
ncbi:MAG: hypothetical protein KKD39_07340, partial [Candidatus Altiarchaeota archaeon]|nr:hypothetical protein [Candidatus Altiarchaeota archaeon]